MQGSLLSRLEMLYSLMSGDNPFPSSRNSATVVQHILRCINNNHSDFYFGICIVVICTVSSGTVIFCLAHASYVPFCYFIQRNCDFMAKESPANHELWAMLPPYLLYKGFTAPCQTCCQG